MKYLPALLVLGQLTAFCASAVHAQEAVNPPLMPNFQEGGQEIDPRMVVCPEWSLQDRLSNLLTDLSKQVHVAFVVEGKPFKPTLRTALGVETTEQLHGKLPDGRVSFQEALQAVASAFDYDAEPLAGSRNVYCLCKRYTDPQDLPDVSFEECRQALHTLIEIAAPLDPHVLPPRNGNYPLVDDLVNALSTDQIDHLPQGIPLADLSPHQRELAQRISLRRYIQKPIEQMEGVVTQMDLIAQSKTPFSHQTLQGEDTIGYSYPSMYARSGMAFIPIAAEQPVLLSFEDCAQYNNGRRSTSPPVCLIAPRSADPLKTSKNPILSLPLPLSAAETKKPGEETATESLPLSQIVADLNPSQTTRVPSPVAYSVEPLVADKKAIVIGRTFAANEQIVNALAQVYGLHVISVPNEVDRSDLMVRIERHHPHVLTQAQDFYTAAQQVFPQPLRRYLVEGPVSAALGDSQNVGNDPGSPKTPISASRRYIMAMKAVFGIKRAAAVQDACTDALFQDLMHSPKMKSTFISAELSSEEKKYIAINFMSHLLLPFNQIITGTEPPYVLYDLRRTYLSGGLNPAGTDIRIAISVRNNSGTLSPWISLGNKYKK